MKLNKFNIPFVNSHDLDIEFKLYLYVNTNKTIKFKSDANNLLFGLL